MVYSLMWTAEEAKYLKAVLHWQETASSDDEKKQRQAEEDARRGQEQQRQPAGEFRILVIGDRGTGKTALLTRFSQGTFQASNQNHPSHSNNERGCRHPITLDITSTSTSTTARKAQPEPCQTYLLDALEFPSQHLLSSPLLAQALRITEAAVLVYSVRDRASFRLAQGLAEFMREYFSPFPYPTTTTSADGGDGGGEVDKGRVYPVLLVGTKCDLQEAAAEEAEERAVSFAEGAKAAQGMKMPGSVSDVPFLEVSARTGEGVERVFQVVGEEVLRVRRAVRARREQAERERMMRDLMEITKSGEGAEGGRKRFSLWRALEVAFGRRRALVGR
ncbi:ras-related and estrogen-regulated growth inhibitor-like protein [Achaetomium macrosporum]|uniref:Ras-related and estrogen-regulated growth inhibitor-like protein n=1 Tax=Achaetomium macrosporum TaxID=79813 RepID=A0AAN7H9H0_9PEZI|nr:ras-related and estrogen-regulated growth inhibitor-like protein [Achaetomium macrosporum]